MTGKASGEGFVSAILINGVPYPIERGEKEIAFSHDVPLEDGSNHIRVVVEDLLGNRSEALVTVISKHDGPGITLSEVVPEEHEGKRFVKVTGEINDSAGIRRILVGTREVTPDGAKNFHLDVTVERTDNNVAYVVRAFDILDNETMAPIDLSQIIRAEKDAADAVSKQVAAERAAEEKATREREQASRQRELARLTALQQESLRLAAVKELADKRAQEKAEAERIARDKAERERVAAEKRQQEQQAAERAAEEKRAAEEARAEQVARQKAEDEQRLREETERIRIANEKEEQERMAAEKAAAEKTAAELSERQQLALQIAEREEVARLKTEAERRKRERIAREQLAQEQAEQERLQRRLHPKLAECICLFPERSHRRKMENVHGNGPQTTGRFCVA